MHLICKTPVCEILHSCLKAQCTNTLYQTFTFRRWWLTWGRISCSFRKCVLHRNLAWASETKFSNNEYSNKFKSVSFLFHLYKFASLVHFQELRTILLGLTVYYNMFVLMTCSLHPVCCVWQVNDIVMFMDPKEKT